MTAQMDIAIVLTSAIIVSGGSTAVSEAETRRQQYLAAARFYTKFASVFLLENSGYDLLNDADFRTIPRLRLRPIAAQEGEARGKGYREFHALDLWYQAEQERPRRIIKITGRYIYANIEDLLAECRAAPDGLLLLDRHHHDRFAVTGIFSIGWVEYGNVIQGQYSQVDDSSGAWIERVLYRTLEASKLPCWYFRHEPDCRGVNGTTGAALQAGCLKYSLKRLLRGMNRLVDRRYLYLRGQVFMPLKKLIR